MARSEKWLLLKRNPTQTALPTPLEDDHRGMLRVLSGDGSTTADGLYFGRDNAGTMEFAQLATMADVGSGDVTGPAASVDGEAALFSGTTGKVLKRLTGSGILKAASGVVSLVTAPSGTIVGTSDAQSLTNKTISGNTNTIAIQDNKFTLQDNTDATKQAQFDLVNIPASTTRVFVLPNVTAQELVATGATQTLTNKTLTTPTIGDFTNATHAHTSAATGGALTAYSRDTQRGMFLRPGFLAGNVTDTLAMATNRTLAHYLGQAPTDLTSVLLQFNVTTGAATITWAEVGIGTSSSAPVGSATVNITTAGFFNVASTFNTTGTKTVTVSVSIAAGTHLWALHGCQATTPYAVRAGLADNIGAGFNQFRDATRPSTMAAATSFAITTSGNSAWIGASWS